MFYYGSHVIHAAAMQIFMNYEKSLRGMNDLEEIVVFLNGRRWQSLPRREAGGGDSERFLRDREARDFAVAHSNHARRHAGGAEVGATSRSEAQEGGGGDEEAGGGDDPPVDHEADEHSDVGAEHAFGGWAGGGL